MIWVSRDSVQAEINSLNKAFVSVLTHASQDEEQASTPFRWQESGAFCL